MKRNFEKTDKRQVAFGTGSEEEVTEKVSLLQDIVERMNEIDMAKLSSRDKDAKRKAELESTGAALCAEAEERVAKRTRKKSLDSVEKDVSTMERELIELEKKKQAEDHAFRMEIRTSV
ncbi:hypothetical protein AeMF1_017848 [Aphanomyces euteiches]|nr:hypothetical protein AeMF1_017848 [Aphanomyces euteiches]KAH9182697.1 hypothetical protein AeNC1_015327 [Aphanomyces euteiches]